MDNPPLPIPQGPVTDYSIHTESKPFDPKAYITKLANDTATNHTVGTGKAVNP